MNYALLVSYNFTLISASLITALARHWIRKKTNIHLNIIALFYFAILVQF